MPPSTLSIGRPANTAELDDTAGGSVGDFDDLAELVAPIPALAGQQFRIAELPGGLTNRNYTLTAADGRRLVVRRSDPGTALLAIDRDAEYRNAVAAAAAGVGPAVVGYRPGMGVLVVEWVDGRTFTDGDLMIGDNLTRVAATCRRLHAGPRFVNDFDLFDVAQGYLRLVFERGFRLPPGYLDFAGQVEQMRAALAVRPEPTVPCHNDLLAANIMDDGRRIWFIDYEYAGNNDPCFELGNLCSEADLPLDALIDLVDAYYGAHSPARIARAQLYSVMSNYGWVLWASIQDATSPIDFDFWSWGLAKYDRAVRAFARPEFATLLNEVQQSR